MRSAAKYPVLLTLVLLAGACSEGSDDAHERDAAPAGTASDHAHASDTATAGEAQPLLPIMRQLAVDMAALQQALWMEDFELVERHAAAVARHANIAPDELARIEGVLGQETAAFDSLDVAVHESAVAMHEASRSGDIDVLLSRLADVQRGCVACHERFRERLRTTPDPG